MCNLVILRNPIISLRLSIQWVLSHPHRPQPDLGKSAALAVLPATISMPSPKKVALSVPGQKSWTGRKTRLCPERLTRASARPAKPGHFKQKRARWSARREFFLPNGVSVCWAGWPLFSRSFRALDGVYESSIFGPDRKSWLVAPLMATVGSVCALGRGSNVRGGLVALAHNSRSHRSNHLH